MRRPAAAAAGFSLVELVVALTLLSVALVALAGTAAVAQRSFASAAATERTARAAAAVIDSLLHEVEPAPGARELDAVRVRWHVRGDNLVLRLDVEAEDLRTQLRVTFHTARVRTAAPVETP